MTGPHTLPGPRSLLLDTELGWREETTFPIQGRLQKVWEQSCRPHLSMICMLRALKGDWGGGGTADWLRPNSRDCSRVAETCRAHVRVTTVPSSSEEDDGLAQVQGGLHSKQPWKRTIRVQPLVPHSPSAPGGQERKSHQARNSNGKEAGHRLRPAKRGS